MQAELAGKKMIPSFRIDWSCSICKWNHSRLANFKIVALHHFVCCFNSLWVVAEQGREELSRAGTKTTPVLQPASNPLVVNNKLLFVVTRRNKIKVLSSIWPNIFTKPPHKHSVQADVYVTIPTYCCITEQQNISEIVYHMEAFMNYRSRRNGIWTIIPYQWISAYKHTMSLTLNELWRIAYRYDRVIDAKTLKRQMTKR